MEAASQTTYGTAKAITTSDSVLQRYSAIYVGATGNLTVIAESGDSLLFTAVPVGRIIRCRVKQVMATGTTAASLVGLQ